jgi:hypothetical protein
MCTQYANMPQDPVPVFPLLPAHATHTSEANPSPYSFTSEETDTSHEQDRMVTLHYLSSVVAIKASLYVTSF